MIPSHVHYTHPAHALHPMPTVQTVPYAVAQPTHTAAQDPRLLGSRPRHVVAADKPEQHVPWTTGQEVLDSLGAEREQNEGDGFMELLDSLEARVDLMAQMQQTRQKLQGLKVEDESAGTPQTTGTLRDCTSFAQEEHWKDAPDPFQAPDLEDEKLFPRAKLIHENQELWLSYTEQRDEIRKLSEEKQKLTQDLAAAQEAVTQSRLAEKEWSLERARLLAEIQELRRASGTQPTSGAQATSPGQSLDTKEIQERLQDLQQKQHESKDEAFSQMCGSNIELSQDGFIATRVRGSRQSVVLGSAPLRRQAGGWYYEVRVREVVDGWVGGLGIGVTKTSPSMITSMLPDKAWRIPQTCVVGYWGCAFIEGKEQKTGWRSDAVAPGSIVGLLISDSGDLRVFVDQVSVALVEGAVTITPDLQMYPVLDIFAATVSVQLQTPDAGLDNTSTVAPATPASEA